MLAQIRPDDWDFPLLLHVLGAMLLVGATLMATIAALAGWRSDNSTLARLAFRTLLLGVIPAWILMRIGAGWIESREGFGDESPGWLQVGVIVAEPGLLLLLIATLLSGLGLRRARKSGGGGGLTRAAGVLAAILLVAYLVAVWAMTAKPGA